MNAIIAPAKNQPNPPPPKINKILDFPPTRDVTFYNKGGNVLMDYDKKESSAADNALEEPAVAYYPGRRIAAEPWAVSAEDWDNGNAATDDCDCPLCREKRIPYEHAVRANARLDTGYEEYAELLIECRRRGYNEETMDAMKESLDISDGKIEAKSYNTVAELMADIHAEEEDD
jgi:hypothetical protein